MKIDNQKVDLLVVPVLKQSRGRITLLGLRRVFLWSVSLP